METPMTFRSTIAMMLTAASVAFAAPVQAQDDIDVPDIAAEDVTTGQIVSFVNAVIALERVRAEYQPKMEAAETTEEREALAAEADEVGIEAVVAVVGISPGEYIAIIKAAQDSEDLAGRIEERVTEIREKQQGKAVLGTTTPTAEE